VVADPRANRAHAMAALLDQCGFTTSLATSGREAFQEAAGSTEVELVLIVMTVENPDADELLRQLRRDPRTARLPVGLIADPDRLYRAEGIALADPLTSAFVRPRDLKTMQERVKTLEGLSGVNHVPHAERLEQARRAMGIISVLTAKPQQLYDFQGVDAAVEPALMVPELWPAAIQVLVHCHTPRAQKALADLASAGTQSIDTRKVAAAAFAESVKRHGIQLSIAQIKHQARLYDQSASLDQPTQDVLWSLLETMQKTKEKANPPPPKKA
jgi:CheY-like chemotaxis protein